MNKVKSITTALITVSLLAGTSFTSAATNTSVEQSLVNVCKASTTNNLIKYNKVAKSYRLKDKTIAIKVMCNGEDIAEFARSHGSYNIAAKLERSLRGNVSISDVAAITKINVNFAE
jgi:hypothetical protein